MKDLTGRSLCLAAWHSTLLTQRTRNFISIGCAWRKSLLRSLCFLIVIISLITMTLWLMLCYPFPTVAGFVMEFQFIIKPPTQLPWLTDGISRAWLSLFSDCLTVMGGGCSKHRVGCSCRMHGSPNVCTDHENCQWCCRKFAAVCFVVECKMFQDN